MFVRQTEELNHANGISAYDTAFFIAFSILELCEPGFPSIMLCRVF